MPRSVVYVSNADSGSISALALDEASGALTALQTVELGGKVMPLALSPDGGLLIAARRSAPLAAVSLRIDGRDGSLTRLGECPLPASMAHIACDRSGRFLVCASYGEHLLAVCPIGADGLLGAAQQTLATPPHAHAIRIDASNRFAFATSLGGDQVLQFRFDAGTGRLAPNVPAALDVRRGAGPRHLALHPNGRFVYLLNELDAGLDVLALDGETGTLAPLQSMGTLPPGFRGKPWAADLQLTPDARFLYSSERGSHTLAGFAVDAATGRLAPLGHWPTQTQPRGFHISPSGRWLIAAGQLSQRVGVHAIDAASGALTLAHEHAVGLDPNWVVTLALPPG